MPGETEKVFALVWPVETVGSQINRASGSRKQRKYFEALIILEQIIGIVLRGNTRMEYLAPKKLQYYRWSMRERCLGAL